ncbi:MAG TPA: M42 family metallopeptidase [Longimicrobiaceae bacterium]|nr:M42 family metallopeptidase [Longimicrobiaceae bacterium]
MHPGSYEFLKRLLDTPGPSGFEIGAARVWRAEAEGFAERVDGDVAGNSLAVVGSGGAPRVMLAGHIDEIGLMVTHIDDDGFLYVDAIGGWDPQVLVGQRLRILTRRGELPGVIGKKPVHLIKGAEEEKGVKVTELWVDLGARDRSEVLERGVRVGDPAVIAAPVLELGNGRIASRSADNRIGAFVVLEALRELAGGPPPAAEVTAVATTQEEIGYHGGGARTATFRADPQVALVVDLTFSTDAPGVEKKQVGEHRLGSGPVLTRGSATHPLVFERLAETAEREAIPYTVMASPRYTSTDADAIYLQRTGVATGVISVPNRYMHTPNEIVALDDLDAAVRLVAAFCRGLSADDDFVER